MLGLQYVSALQDAMSKVRSQASTLEEGAKMIVDSAVDGGHLFVHDPTNMIMYEVLIRSSGLYMVKPLRLSDLPRSGVSSKDVVVVFSSRSYLQAERSLLERIRGRGAKIVGVFPAAAPPAHGNPLLADYCDLVVDSAVPDNQGTVAIPGFSEKLGPLDIVVHCVIAWSLCAQVIGEFLRRGLKPSVYMTLRAQGGAEYDSKIWEQFRRQGY